MYKYCASCGNAVNDDDVLCCKCSAVLGNLKNVERYKLLKRSNRRPFKFWIKDIWRELCRNMM